MPADDHALVLRAAAILHANGQQSDATEATATRLGRHFGLDPVLDLSWTGVAMRGTPGDWLTGQPSNVNMQRVIAATEAVDDLLAGGLDRAGFAAALDRAETLPPYSDAAYALAAMAGALALAVIFGGHRWQAFALIALSAGAGAFIRRWMGSRGAGAIGQAFAAALLAGLIGALAVRWDVSSVQRLVALCPCMILVPGPHLLNGALDLLSRRLPLGMARLGFGCVILLAIAGGVVTGLLLGGSDLPLESSFGPVPLWLDMVAASVAAAAYSTYFAMPLRMFIWPMMVGALAHGGRWIAMHEAGIGLAVAGGIACLIAGTLLAPLARWRNVPFAAAGFAAVVALIPGLYVFRATSGLMELVSASADTAPAILTTTAQDAATAILMMAAMVVGLFVPERMMSLSSRWKS